ncbi:hypothetical protein Patl1_29808 [Pistacia atlantica]|uniref:Uncharacterized protein n=1 Tax=Pistacia atlantica TaxID=434234 RepID=A0ACC1ADC5_9ROSI|nr:hypothetical protein Patl1_29808 [Pistacia atlantica]
MAETKQNVILFPFMAQGHIIPFLALALHIQKTRKNCTITFVNTPLNIKKLRSSLPKSSSINFVEIPFNSSLHGLPPDSENCDALPYSLIIQLLRASASLKPAFRELINDLIYRNNGADAPLCIIADIFFGWTAGVAQEFNVFHAIFSGAGGFGLACYYSVWRNLPHKKGESEDFLLPDFEEAGKIQKTQLALSMLQADGSDPWSLFQGGNLPEYVNSNGILFNTVKEFDKLGLKYFNRKLNRPVWAIGPILLSLDNRAQAGKDKESGISSEFCKECLSHMKELAMALEASEKNFIWVVRPPIGFDINSEFRGQEWLPEGFEERVILGSKRGLLVKKWAPQVEILSHKAIGGFLSHCGWNSVLEALIHGVPILGWPMAAEQFFNVKFLEEEMGICVEVARGKTCELRHEDIEAKIEMVMSVKSKKGIEIRRNVGKVREMIKNAMRDEEYKGSSVKAMDEFFNAALSMKEKNKRKLINGA